MYTPNRDKVDKPTFIMRYRVFSLVNGKESDAERTHTLKDANIFGMAQYIAHQTINEYNRQAIETAKASGIQYTYVLTSVERKPDPEAGAKDGE